jgi:HEAT repeat protein
MVILAMTLVVLYGYGCHLIFSGVQNIAREAQATYAGGPVVALIALVEDEQALFEQRNTAIWALGQIGDRRALPVLEGLHTDEVQHPPYDSTSYIVQYSVEKALKQINGFTVTKWMYRWLD